MSKASDNTRAAIKKNTISLMQVHDFFLYSSLQSNFKAFCLKNFKSSIETAVFLTKKGLKNKQTTIAVLLFSLVVKSGCLKTLTASIKLPFF